MSENDDVRFLAFLERVRTGTTTPADAVYIEDYVRVQRTQFEMCYQAMMAVANTMDLLNEAALNALRDGE